MQGYNARLQAEETNTANNKISATKSKTFADVDARFEDVEFDTTLMATNLVTNGDFSNGLTGWLVVNGTGTVANKILTATASNINSTPYVYSALDSVVTGDIYYIKVNARVLNAVCNYIRLQNGDGSPMATRNTPTTNVWYTLSAVGKINGTNRNIMVQHSYTDATTANGKIIEVQYASTLNLTTIFGKGNEPTVEQMDEIMSRFTNSWFDGTKNLFRASEALKKQIAIDARTEFDAKNLVTNGDFSNGTTGWLGFNGNTLSASNNILLATADGTIGAPYVSTTLMNLRADRKYYLSAKIRMNNSGNSALKLELRLYSSAISNAQIINSPSKNVWINMSAIHTPTGLNSPMKLDIVTRYLMESDTVGATTEIQYVSIIDLTATFGAGKEPTLAEMDRLMARYPNSWFDGKQPLNTIRNLYTDKANKVQEAWITPTLLNGWIQQSGGYATVGYMKDEMGFVHLRGTIAGGGSATTAFVLPVGYRTSANLRFPTALSTTVSGLIQVSNVGQVIPYVTSTITVPLDGITFRAEQ